MYYNNMKDNIGLVLSKSKIEYFKTFWHSFVKYNKDFNGRVFILNYDLEEIDLAQLNLLYEFDYYYPKWENYDNMDLEKVEENERINLLKAEFFNINKFVDIENIVLLDIERIVLNNFKAVFDNEAMIACTQIFEENIGKYNLDKFDTSFLVINLKKLFERKPTIYKDCIDYFQVKENMTNPFEEFFNLYFDKNELKKIPVTWNVNWNIINVNKYKVRVHFHKISYAGTRVNTIYLKGFNKINTNNFKRSDRRKEVIEFYNRFTKDGI